MVRGVCSSLVKQASQFPVFGAQRRTMSWRNRQVLKPHDEVFQWLRLLCLRIYAHAREVGLSLQWTLLCSCEISGFRASWSRLRQERSRHDMQRCSEGEVNLQRADLRITSATSRDISSVLSSWGVETVGLFVTPERFGKSPSRPARCHDRPEPELQLPASRFPTLPTPVTSPNIECLGGCQTVEVVLPIPTYLARTNYSITIAALTREHASIMASRPRSRIDSRATSRSVSSASLPLDASSIKEKPDEATAEKTAAIMGACAERNLAKLIGLATSEHGLVNDTLRRSAWPILLGCTSTNDEITEKQRAWSELPEHRDEEQVAKDVNRAFVHYPRETDKQLDRRKQELSNVIVEVLRRHPSLCYFQGYHDIVQVLYLVLATPINHSNLSTPAATSSMSPCVPAVTRLSLLRIRDYMLPSLSPAIRHLELLPVILQQADPELYAHLPQVQANYALGATLTLFSHVIEEYRDITRLFDFFLASDAAVPVYFFASIILSRREELLAIEKDEDEAIFYVVLGKLPQPFDIEGRIQHTLSLYERLPPQKLKWAWWKVSSSSVLKATRTPYDVSRLSLEDGQKLFAKQDREVRIHQAYVKAVQISRRFKMRAWRYRRPGAVGLAIAVGIYALYLGRNGRAVGLGLTSFGTIGTFVGRIMGFFVGDELD